MGERKTHGRRHGKPVVDTKCVVLGHEDFHSSKPHDSGAPEKSSIEHFFDNVVVSKPREKTVASLRPHVTWASVVGDRKGKRQFPPCAKKESTIKNDGKAKSTQSMVNIMSKCTHSPSITENARPSSGVQRSRQCGQRTNDAKKDNSKAKKPLPTAVTDAVISYTLKEQNAMIMENDWNAFGWPLVPVHHDLYRATLIPWSDYYQPYLATAQYYGLPFGYIANSHMETPYPPVYKACLPEDPASVRVPTSIYQTPNLWWSDPGPPAEMQISIGKESFVPDDASSFNTVTESYSDDCASLTIDSSLTDSEGWSNEWSSPIADDILETSSQTDRLKIDFLPRFPDNLWSEPSSRDNDTPEKRQELLDHLPSVSSLLLDLHSERPSENDRLLSQHLDTAGLEHQESMESENFPAWDYILRSIDIE